MEFLLKIPCFSPNSFENIYSPNQAFNSPFINTKSVLTLWTSHFTLSPWQFGVRHKACGLLLTIKCRIIISSLQTPCRSWHPVHHQGPWRRYTKGGQLWFGLNSGVIPAFPPQWLKKFRQESVFFRAKVLSLAGGAFPSFLPEKVWMQICCDAL